MQPADVTAKLLPVIESIRLRLPAGYRIETGGTVEESSKANASLYKVFPVMILVMLTLLMVQLQSFGKVFLVTTIAPLAIIGVSVALLAFSAPFGFVVLLGVISLAGMDMRNSVILMDQIKHDIDSGLSPWQAVIESTVRRARPVRIDRGSSDPGDDPADPKRFLGADGHRHHGRTVVGYVLNAGESAGSVRAGVPSAGARGEESNRRRRR